ncbi:MAG: DUF72 domain-containing protein [Bacillota bacterium]
MIRVGTCSWADKSMVEAWYPADVRSPEGLLRYYSQHFDTVEVDSTFYALPPRRYAQNWAERTPDRFTFHVKAFAAMTGHRVKADRLPAELKSGVDAHGNPDPALVRESFSRFLEGIEPLRSRGKLGVVLLQFPPSFRANGREELRHNLAWLYRAAELLAGVEGVVEFRHRSWFREEVFPRTRSFLAGLGLGLVTVDEPQVGSGSIPTVVAPTSSTGYVRLHGRNARTWRGRVATAAERFRYLYDQEELGELLTPIKKMARETETTYVMFNNCYADYAPENALTLRSLLEENG